MFTNSNNGLSLSDIAAVTNNEGINGNSGWWVLIILFAMFGGWGGNGFGFNRGTAYPAATAAEVQAGFDQQTLLNKVERQTEGIANVGFSMNNAFSQAELSRANQQAATMAQLTANNNTVMQGTFELKSAIDKLACENTANTGVLVNAINQMGQSIIQNDNANYRQLHDENIALQMANKDAIIADLTNKKNWLELQASQCAQNQYLISQLKTSN